MQVAGFGLRGDRGGLPSPRQARVGQDRDGQPHIAVGAENGALQILRDLIERQPGLDGRPQPPGRPIPLAEHRRHRREHHARQHDRECRRDQQLDEREAVAAGSPHGRRAKL